MELDQALADIAEIRRRMDRCGTFRGYRSVPVAISGCLAMLAAAVQAHLLPQPDANIGAYLGLWIGVAFVSATISGTEVLVRYRRAGSAAQRQLTRHAVGQFLPCLVVGAILTAILVNDARLTPLLPGLWAMVFSLGIFASTLHLPRLTVVAGVHYLLSGSVALLVFRDDLALSPWAMILTFGVGQFVSSFILYRQLERAHGE